jgi:hypothetical protein
VQHSARFLGTLAAVAWLVVPIRTVCAEESEPGGLHLDATLGLGVTSGSYQYERNSAPYDGSPVQRLQFEAGLDGPAVALSVAPAFALSRELALGLALDTTIFPSLEQHGRIGESSIGGGLLVGAAAALKVRPRRFGFEASLACGVQRATLYGSTNDIASPENVYEHESAVGPRAALRMGYVHTSGFGVSTAGSYAWLEGEHSVYRPLVFLAEATLSTW